MNAKTRRHDLEAENQDLRERLAEAEETLLAIQRGEIDALIVQESDQQKIFTLQGADHPYRVLVESMSEGAATLSRDGVILYANPRLAALLEVSGSTLSGTRLSDWAAPEDRESLIGAMDNGAAQSRPHEVSLVTSGGQSLPVHASFSPLSLDGQEFQSAIISDQRLAKHHEALEVAAQRIHEANNQLRLADERKDAFLATLAHELRNPLAPIRAAVEFLCRTGEQDPRHARACEIIERQVTHMTRLVDDLMEISRITLGRLKLQRQSESLRRVLGRVADSIESSPDLRQELVVDLPDDELLLQGDTVRLSQALSNILDNAIKYTPADGRIEVRAVREDGHAVITVRDTGIGFSPQASERIFEMFTQEASRGEQAQGGLGIGLALTRSIVELHGGEIRASSPGLGQGSEFVIRLPLEDPGPAQAAAGDPDEQPPATTPLSILIVDDNRDAAESLSMLLKLSNHSTATAHSGKEALAVAERQRPDLVLLDIGLPDWDGYEVARRLRALFDDACPRLIALSGWGRAEDRRRAEEAGIDSYLTKPVSPPVLQKLLDEHAVRSRSAT